MATRKDVAVSFLRHAASGRVREAYHKHVSKGFSHHNPFFAGNAEALIAGMEENARRNPGKRQDVLHALEDGDLVAVHSHVRQKPDDRGLVVVHFFRFEGDRIAELWTSASRCRPSPSTRTECSEGGSQPHHAYLYFSGSARLPASRSSLYCHTSGCEPSTSVNPYVRAS